MCARFCRLGEHTTTSGPLGEHDEMRGCRPQDDTGFFFSEACHSVCTNSTGQTASCNRSRSRPTRNDDSTTLMPSGRLMAIRTRLTKSTSGRSALPVNRAIEEDGGQDAEHGGLDPTARQGRATILPTQGRKDPEGPPEREQGSSQPVLPVTVQSAPA